MLGDYGVEAAMTDESGRTPESAEGQDAWREMLRSVDQFGEAVASWVRQQVNDPQNRERAQEVKQHLESAADKVGEAVNKGEIGRSATDAANRAGAAMKDAGEKFGQEIGPSMADFFRAASAGLSGAAAYVDSKAKPQSGPGDASAAASGEADDSGLQNPPED